MSAETARIGLIALAFFYVAAFSLVAAVGIVVWDRIADWREDRADLHAMKKRR